MPEINQREIKYSVVIPTFNRLNQLKILLDSIFEQDIDRNTYEVIVVNDGGSDGTSGYIKNFPAEFNIRLLEIENSGPSIARNKGALIASGEIIAFVDSDCTVPKDWLIKFGRKFEEVQTSAIGGTSLNKVPENPAADVYDRMNQFFLAMHNTDLNKSRFLMTNNLAVKRDIFVKYGGFDERFTIGAEDREFVCRLIAGGESVYFDKDNIVDHHHNFSTRSFFFHHYRFGRGSHLLLNVVKKEKNLDVEKLPFKDYLRLFSAIGSGDQFLKKIHKRFLFFMSQLFIFLGYLSGIWEGIKDLREEKAETSATFTSGKKGTMMGLFSFLFGNVFSSVFGFISFVIIGRSLSIPNFGLFMFAFSTQMVLGKIAEFGLTTSVTRYASEYSKKGDEKSAINIIHNGMILQLIMIVLVILALALSTDFLDKYVFDIKLTPQITLAIVSGLAGTLLFDYVTSVYSIYLKFITLSLIYNVIALIRIIFILIIYFLDIHDPIVYYWIFILPNWLGILPALASYLKLAKNEGKFSFATSKKIFGYGGWQALTGISKQVSKHIGALILAAYVSQKDVGLFGLGLSLSMIYSVILSNVNSYFMPIGSRLSSDNEIIPFIRRTIRLTLPISILCAVSLLVSKPVVVRVYGLAKVDAYWIFVLLSLPAILKILFTPLSVLSHYFFKPNYIASEAVLNLILFISFSYALINYAAFGVATAILITNIMGIIYLVFLLKSRFTEKSNSA